MNDARFSPFLPDRSDYGERTASAAFGTTTAVGSDGAGAVFRLTSAAVETVLYSFIGEAPGPFLARDSAGKFYGSTFSGGSYGGGTVFKLDPSGDQTAIYSFSLTNGDGASPEAGLVMGSAGNLYGTTADGSSGGGTVFKVTPGGAETTLYSFTGTNGDGAIPVAGLIWDSLGNLYGTTYGGGSAGLGTVFKLTTPAPIFTLSASALSPSPVTQGQSASSTITVSSVNSFNSAVDLTCSVSPSPSLAPSCAFSANSVTPAANGTATPTLTISTTAATASATRAAIGQEGRFYYALWLPIPFLVLLGAPGYNSKQRKCLGMLLGLVLTAGITAQLGCSSSGQGGGGGNAGTPAGNYTVTVTATSGSTTNTATITLNVQ